MKKQVTVTVFFLFSAFCFSQNLCPEAQKELSAILFYMQSHQATFNKTDSLKIDSMNKRVNYLQVKCDEAKLRSDSTPDSAVVKNNKKIIMKQGFAGSSVFVPPNEKWILKAVYCSYNGSYNIRVTSISFKKNYGPGENFHFPEWTSEGELLNNDSMTLLYSVEFYLE